MSQPEEAKRANLLLVDDRPENLVALEAILEPLGQNLVKANSGREALKHLLTEDFALILLDVQMPEMDGFETAALIKEREKSRHVPIIFITAISTDVRYVFQGYSAGAVDYLPKPFDPDILKAKVSVFVDLWEKGEQIKRQAELLRLSEQREAERQRAEQEAQLEAARRTVRTTASELQKSEERYRSLISATSQIVWTSDPYGEFTEELPAWGAFTGQSPDARKGRGWLQAVHLDDRAHTADAWNAAVASGDRFEVEHRIRKADGTYRHMAARAVPVREPDGRIREWIGAHTDITERKQAEAALEAAYQKQRRIADVLQGSLLFAPPEDQFPGLTLSTHYESAWDESSYGGDFFDAFAVEGGKVAFVVGDVSGKGLAAAARTTEVKYALRAFLRESGDPQQAVERLNDVVCDTHRLDDQGFGTFICLALAVVDTRTGETSVVAAGTEPPLLVSESGAAQPVEASGLPLGIEPGEAYQAKRLSLLPGDGLLLVTDGITEARAADDFFGYEGLARTANEAAARGALGEVGKAVMDAARRFAGGKLQDDACLLLVRRAAGR